ncbi:unnamed protein product, partial [Didymodactylos carnosus]
MFQPVKPSGCGRGHGREQVFSSIAPPSPSISSTSLTHVATTSGKPDTLSDEGIASSIVTLNIPQPTTAIKSTVPHGRGQVKRDVPYFTSKKSGRSCFITDDKRSKWIVSELTEQQFLTTERPLKPKTLGELGLMIQVMVNCYPVTWYPKEGIEIFKFIIRLTDKSIDFAKLVLPEDFDSLECLKQVLSSVLHEQCSSTANFVNKRVFYSI